MTTMKQPFQCNLQLEIQEPHGTTHTDTTTRCKTHRRNNSRTKRPQPHPSHTRGTFPSSPAATLHGKTQGFVLRLPPQNIAHATFMQPLQCVSQHPVANPHLSTHVATSNDDNEAAIPMQFCNQRFKNRIELRTQTQRLVAKHIGGTIRAQNDRSRTRRTDEVPFIVGCSHFTRKNTRFGAPASSPKHSPCNIHAAITMRFATSRGKPAPIYARGNIKWRQWSSHSNAICNQRFKNRIELRTQTQPLVAKHIGGTIRPQNDRSRTRRTDQVPFIVGCSHFTRKNTRFGPQKHSPCNIHAAITMRFATSRGKPAHIYARGNIKWRQWSSHSNAICNQRFKNRIELRTQTQPLIAKHIGGTIRAQNDRSRTRRTNEVPFIAGCSHFTRKNTRFRAPASSPKHRPCNIHAAIPMRSATTTSRNA